MRHFQLVLTLTLTALTYSGALNATVINFRAPVFEQLDGSAELEFLAGQVTVSALTSHGVFNRTSAGFGVNAVGGGDDADAIDGDLGDEYVEIRFDQAVSLKHLHLSGFGRADVARVTFGSVAWDITTSGPIDLEDTRLLSQAPITVRHVSGNGISLDSIEFSLAALPTTVPEPDARFLLAVAFLLLAGRSCTRRKLTNQRSADEFRSHELEPRSVQITQQWRTGAVQAKMCRYSAGPA